MKWFHLLLPVAALALGLCACAGGPTLQSTSRDEKPQWLDRLPYKQGDLMFYVGRSTGAGTPDDAVELARADALRTLVQELGVTVSEQSKAFQEERNGEFSYDVQMAVTARSEPVKLRGIALVDRYVETWARSGIEHDGFVLLSVPRTELARALRTVAAKVLVVWECEPSAACGATLAERVRAVVSKAGRPLVAETVVGPPESLASLGVQKGAAYVLHVRVNADFLSEIEGEFFANGNAVAQLVDTGEDKVVMSLEIGPVKGGHFSRSAAVKAAVKETVNALVGRLQTQL